MGFTLFCDSGSEVLPVGPSPNADTSAHEHTWVVVKNMVPFWVPIIVRHLLLGYPKRTLILTTEIRSPVNAGRISESTSQVSVQKLRTTFNQIPARK